MNAFLTVTATAQRVKNWHSLYSDEWAGAPRQSAPEFCAAKMKDCGADSGLPDQWYFKGDPWIQLTEKRARWLFDLQCLAWRGKKAGALTRAEWNFASAQWAQLFDDGRCFTNKAGTDTHHDYITGANPLADDMSYQLLLLAGNRVDVLGGMELFPENYFNVQKAYPHRPIRALDIDNLPPVEAVLEDPFVCHRCTTIQPDGTHGTFPQFEGQAHGVIWAKFGRAWIWERLIAP